MTVKEIINQVEMLYGRQHHMYLKRLMNDALVDISSEAKHYKATFAEDISTDKRWYGIPDGIIEIQRVDVLNSDGKYELVPNLLNYDELLIGDDDGAHSDDDTDDDGETGSTGDNETRKDVNGKFAYYIQGDELALLYKNQTTGKYGTWNGDDVPSGIRYTAVAIYSPLETFNDDLFDVVYPFGDDMYQRQVKTDDALVSEFIKDYDYRMLDEVSKVHTSDYGWVQYFNRQVYIDGGMENENFIAYAPEDKERYYRFKKLGYRVERIDNWVYHLEHTRGENSWFTNPHMQSNMDEWNKIQSMNREQLKEYYSQQDYLKKYVNI